MNENLLSEAEIPRYRKKAKKRSAVRSDHKHDCEDIILISPPFSEHHRVCRICGKIIFVDFAWEKLNGAYHMITDIERLKRVYPEYKIMTREELDKLAADYADKTKE